MDVSVMWFRRDLRLRDNPALLAAAGQGGLGDGPSGVVPLFVVDPALWKPAGPARRAYLLGSLAALSERIGGDGVLLRRGDPVDEVVSVARAATATAVHVAADFGPYGRARDERVEAALAEHGIALLRLGSPYAVAPGRIRNSSGDPYQVYSPFYRAWRAHGWRAPAPSPRAVDWAYPLVSHDAPAAAVPDGMELPTAGEEAAMRRWRAFRDGPLADYEEARDRPDLRGTSQLSTALKYGEVHPRTLLADLAELPSHPLTGDPAASGGAATFAKELAWREFYADVLFHQPHTAREYLRAEYARMRYTRLSAAECELASTRAARLKGVEERSDDHVPPAGDFEAWCSGRTGYPFVDAGMRQLRAEGWIHNRVRMVVASFLVKDLHVEWQHGARHFMRWLRDGDLASNQHGWQWVAGCGTDAAPYFRVFNPVGQGQKFDPDGAYVRRYVPELRHLDGKAAHTPWAQPDGYAHGYPTRIVDHAEERAEALARLSELNAARDRMPAADRGTSTGADGGSDGGGVATRTEQPGAQAWVPDDAGIRELAKAATGCEGCELFGPATQVVFSKGSLTPRVVLVGEQPGDQEDRQGLPFVGPAGRLLDRALAEAGIDPATTYTTNAVKHFRFELRGQRRLHQTPDPAHVLACRPWLAAELAELRPQVIVALGATAGKALLGPSFRVTRQRGVLMPWPEKAVEGLVAHGAPAAHLLATLHPSAVLRADDQVAAYAGLVADLKVAAAALS